MRLDALMAAAALTLGGAMPLALAQQSAQPTQPTQPTQSTTAPAAVSPPAMPRATAAQQPATASDAQPGDPFPPGWTGRPESAADAQREARAAAAEALKECRRQAGGDPQRCGPAARRSAPSGERAARPRAAKPRSSTTTGVR